MSDHERPQDRALRLMDELDEGSETWTPLTDAEYLDRQHERTRLLDPDGTLTTFAADVLVFEQGWWKYPAAKEAEVRRRWDISSTRYYQLLNALIDTPAAYAHDVLTVKRLTKLRDARRDARTPTAPPDHGSELF